MGTAFELHIERVLHDIAIPFVPQPKIGNRKPDFLMPSLKKYKNTPSECIILSAKSTLGERWQQILNEGATGHWYLATLDRTITDQSMADMNVSKITVVVPESFVAPKSSASPRGVYFGKPNAMSFRDFFDGPLRNGRTTWQ